MSEIKPLSAEQLEDLREMPIGPYDVLAERDKIDRHTPLIEMGFCRRIYAGRRDGILQQTVGRTPLADRMIATITNERQQAAEGERRRIDGLIRMEPGSWKFYVAHGSERVCAAPYSSQALECGDTFIEALEAATNSLNKEQTQNGN